MLPLNERQQHRALRKAAAAAGEDISKLLETPDLMEQKERSMEERRAKPVDEVVITQVAISGIRHEQAPAQPVIAKDDTQEAIDKRNAEQAGVSGPEVSQATIKAAAAEVKAATGGGVGKSSWTKNVPPAA